MKVLAIILAGGKRQELAPLVNQRCKAAIHIMGRFRIIDFVLSNCINSGIRQINVMVQYKYESLQKHIRDGWSFFSPRLGEYIDVYQPQQRFGDDWYLGTANAIYQNLFAIEDVNPDIVLLLSGDHLYKMNYRYIIDYHLARNADLTVGSIPIPLEQAHNYGNLVFGEDNRILHFAEKPENPIEIKRFPGNAVVNMSVYVFNANALKKVILESADNKQGNDLGRDIIPTFVAKGNAYNYLFVNTFDRPYYWNFLLTMKDYYQANMELFNPKSEISVFDNKWPIRTLQTQGSPARIINSENAKGYLSNSAIYSSSTIKGSVINSIVGSNVYVDEGTEITGSILFNNIKLGKNCKIKNAIIDNHTVIKDNVTIGYDHEVDSKKFIVKDNLTIIERHSHITS